MKDIIKTFGEEEDASKISKNIVKRETKKQLNTTDELVKIIQNSKKKNYKKKLMKVRKHFKLYECLSIKKSQNLIEGIIKATQILKPGGKLNYS